MAAQKDSLFTEVWMNNLDFRVSPCKGNSKASYTLLSEAKAVGGIYSSINYNEMELFNDKT